MPFTKGLMLIGFFSVAWGVLTGINTILLALVADVPLTVPMKLIALSIAFIETLISLELIDRCFVRTRSIASIRGATDQQTIATKPEDIEGSPFAENAENGSKQQIVNILDYISANFRLLRERIDPVKFQPFCGQILQLARRVQVLRYNDNAIPDNESVDTLAMEAANAIQGCVDLFGDELPREWSQQLVPGRVRQREPRLNPRQALLEAIASLGAVIEHDTTTRTD